ncbi:MAG: nucleotidyltransferase family protein [Acidobacteriota bacterium]|nr:nucleotidyltransferase family protein [Acidobacteriota bacterium]
MTGPVSGVVLAAGLSTRFETGAGKPKQLYRIGGESLVRRTCRAALTSGLGEVVLVTGYAAERVQSEVEDLDLRAAHNPSYADGQSGSVRCGLAAVADDAGGAMFLPVDQPGLDAAVIDRLLGVFHGPGSIIVPTFRGRRGAPVTFGRDWFTRLEGLRGDEGARPLLCELAARVQELELDSELPLVDIDTEDEARSWLERSATP